MSSDRATYLAVIRHSVFRQVVPGLLVSGLGDGMSLVAIPWTALAIAHGHHAGALVGAALAAYTLPGALGAYALQPVCRRLTATQLAAADGILRAVTLGAIPVMARAHVLSPPLFLVALSSSSVLYAWGIAGRFSFLAENLTGPSRLAANTVALTGRQAASMLGSLVAGPLVGLVGSSGVIGLDAATFAVLGVSYLVVPLRNPGSGEARPDRPNPIVELGALRHAGPLAYFISVSLLFIGCNGAVRAAIPLYVVGSLHGSAHLLGFFWTAAGMGAIVGGASTRHLYRWRISRVMVVSVVVTGMLLIPVVVTSGLPSSLVLFALANACAAPLPALAFFMTQQLCEPEALSGILATRSSLVMIAGPVGNGLGGLLLTMQGARGTILIAALVMIAGGLCAWELRRRRPWLTSTSDGPVLDNPLADSARVVSSRR